MVKKWILLVRAEALVEQVVQGMVLGKSVNMVVAGMRYLPVNDGYLEFDYVT